MVSPAGPSFCPDRGLWYHQVETISSGKERKALDSERVKEIEEAIAELKSRWPAHSVPPHMWQQLEDLEEQLEKAKREEGR
jgi:hypothetical protein